MLRTEVVTTSRPMKMRLAVSCPLCKAQPGEQCTTIDGDARPTKPHTARVEGAPWGNASTPPARTLAQRAEALQRANGIRSSRAVLKRDLKARRQSIARVLVDPPEFVLTAKAFDLLVAVPKIGRVKASAALNHCRISHSKTVGGLTERQRRELVDYLVQR